MQPDNAAPVAGDTLKRAAIKVLRAGDPHVKAQYGAIAARLWEQGEIAAVCRSGDAGAAQADVYDLVPDEPARDEKVKSVAPKDIPKRGKGGSLQSRQALIHSLVHIENCAIDLSWDIIARFCDSTPMPRAFYDDFVRIASEEGKHFSLLAQRLQELGSSYGALPVHQGLWETASATAGSLSARLALEHCVHEARGLDVVPQTINRFRAAGDHESADLLECVIYPEEITHCAAGVRWFTYLCCREMRLVKGPLRALTNGDARTDVHEQSNGHFQEEDAMESLQSGLNPDTGIRELDEMATERLQNGLRQDVCLQDPDEMAAEALQNGLKSDFGVREPDEMVTDTLQNGLKSDIGMQQHPDGRSADDTERTSTGQEGDLDMDVVMGAVGDPYVVEKFHATVRAHFRGVLKPPFNTDAREKAGFVKEWYVPLAQK